MIRFECDYTEGAHPTILEALLQTNMIQTPGYGTDEYCEQARQLIRQKCEDETVDVHFLVGGTQTNKTVIASILRSHEGILAADTSHISTHEAGAIESTGHKILTLNPTLGKITAKQIKEAYESHINQKSPEHEVKPGMVFISHPTELGTLYTKKELVAIREVCDEYELPLFLDGARLGYGLTANSTDVTLADITRLCDVYYIGGTKCGMLFGEAVVIKNQAIKRDFRYMMKQNGALFAKGRLLGIQFKCLFESDLYYEITKKANEQASRIKEAFHQNGYSFLIETDTNQLFPIVTNDMYQTLSQTYAVTYWERVNETHCAIRLCTSWATQDEFVEQLVNDIHAL